MEIPSTKALVDAFVQKINRHLHEDQLEGPVRLDNTNTVVIIPVKGKGPIHARIRGGVDDEGALDIVRQLESVPSLKSLVKSR